jgi:hypothetical protein
MAARCNRRAVSVTPVKVLDVKPTCHDLGHEGLPQRRDRRRITSTFDHDRRRRQQSPRRQQAARTGSTAAARTVTASSSRRDHDRRRRRQARRPIADGIASSSRRARQRHDGGRRSRHVSDPQPGLGGACRLEAAHSVPPEIRTCNRRPRQANAFPQTVPDKFGLLLRFASRTASRHRAIITPGHPGGSAQATDTPAPGSAITTATTRHDGRQREGHGKPLQRARAQGYRTRGPRRSRCGRTIIAARRKAT